MVKPAGRKTYRRGRKKNKCIKENSDNKCILYHLNIRGFNSKRISLENIVRKLSPAIITLNETHLKFKQKPKLSNYFSYDRNRISESMGGISTFVKNKDKDDFIKICEGDQNDEFLVTRHVNFIKPLNVINIYGEQECRSKKADIEDRWGRILTEVLKIERRNEFILLIGDMNKQ